MEERIRVKIKSTGQTGTIPKSQYNPQSYEMIGGEGMGATVGQTPQQTTSMSPSPQTGALPSGRTPSPSGATSPSSGGLDLDKLNTFLGFMAMSKGQFSAASSIFQKTKNSAKEQERIIQANEAKRVGGELDKLGKDWDNIPLWQRLPIPGVSRVAPERAKYETARNLYNYQLIVMHADKRITDAERDYFLDLFPKLLESGTTAKTKLNALKEVLRVKSELVSPYKETSQASDLGSIMEMFQGTQ